MYNGFYSQYLLCQNYDYDEKNTENKPIVQEDLSVHIKIPAFGHSFSNLSFMLAECRQLCPLQIIPRVSMLVVSRFITRSSATNIYLDVSRQQRKRIYCLGCFTLRIVLIWVIIVQYKILEKHQSSILSNILQKCFTFCAN